MVIVMRYVCTVNSVATLLEFIFQIMAVYKTHAMENSQIIFNIYNFNFILISFDRIHNYSIQ